MCTVHGEGNPDDVYQVAERQLFETLEKVLLPFAIIYLLCSLLTFMCHVMYAINGCKTPIVPDMERTKTIIIIISVS